MGVDLSEVIATNTDETTSQDNPIMSHIVSKKDDDTRTVQAILMEARINGTAVEALCGHVFVPSRDPQKYPPCQKCVDLVEFDAQFYGDNRPIGGG